MSVIDIIYSNTGLNIGADSFVGDTDAQNLVASLLVLVARCDGGISTEESLRMVELLRGRFNMNPGEALDMISRATDELAIDAGLQEVLPAVGDELSLAQKENLMLMVLHVISADNRKDAEEMSLLVTLIEELKLPDKIMEKVYEQYFEDQFYGDRI